MEAQSIDGKSYPVQLYSDISAGTNCRGIYPSPLIMSVSEWASGDRSSVVQWSNVNTGSSIYHKIQLQSPQPNAENANQAQDGTTYYAMSTVSIVASRRFGFPARASPFFLLNANLRSLNLASHGK